jgi:hypothetical protein
MYRTCALVVALSLSAGLVAAFGWWILLVTAGLSLLTIVFSTESEDASVEPAFPAGTQPAAL